MTKEQIDEVCNFAREHGDTAFGYAMCFMDQQGHVKSQFNCNSIQLAYMVKAMDNTCTKMIDAPMPGPNLPKKRALQPVPDDGRPEALPPSGAGR